MIYEQQREEMQTEIFCARHGIDYDSDLRDWKYVEKKPLTEKCKYSCEPDDIRIITHFPNQVIDFIKRCDFWQSQLDTTWDARRVQIGQL